MLFLSVLKGNRGSEGSVYVDVKRGGGGSLLVWADVSGEKARGGGGVLAVEGGVESRRQ